MEPAHGYGMYIKQISDYMDKDINRNLERHNLTHSQSRFLMALFHRETQCASLKQLENLFGVAQSTMAGIAVRLESKGLIVSFTDAQDRRIKHVQLTEAGRNVCQASHDTILATENRLVSGLTGIERQIFLDLLQKVYQAVR